MKTCIEDVAFNMWNGQEDSLEFADWYLGQFPAFGNYWGVEDLAEALRDRL